MATKSNGKSNGFVELEGETFEIDEEEAPVGLKSKGAYIAGVYRGHESVKVQGKDRTIHQFDRIDPDTGEIKRARLWGTTIVDRRLCDNDQYLGRKIAVMRGDPIGDGPRAAVQYNILVPR
jgi:hypothetical protein